MAASYVDKVLQKWDVARLPDDARRSPTHSISFGLMITHLRRGDTLSRIHIEWPMNAHTYSLNDWVHRVR
jgi:hypothetical protein